MKNKNQKLLKDFIKYCEKHPEERFWQALRNWSEVDSIIIKKYPINGIIYKEDTFYFEGKDE